MRFPHRFIRPAACRQELLSLIKTLNQKVCFGNRIWYKGFQFSQLGFSENLLEKKDIFFFPIYIFREFWE